MVTIEKKTAAVVLAIILLSTSVLIASNVVHFDNDKEIDIISRVNEEGSMIFIKTGEDTSDYCTITGTEMKITETQAKEWGGRIFGTPGVTTIQHKMLEQFVRSPRAEDDVYVPNVTGLGLKFDQYFEGTTEIEDDTVYFIPSMTNKAMWEQMRDNQNAFGGIIWESVCSMITMSGSGTELINSKVLSPGHACCVIAATHNYLNQYPWVATQFIAGFVETVDKINDILETGSGAEYEDLIDFVCRTTMTSREIAIRALGDVKYTYGNDHEDTDTEYNPLVSLKNDIAGFIKNQPALVNTINGMGYVGETAAFDYANQMVNDKYLRQVLTGEKYTMRDAHISVAFITGDIHQIALQYGMEKHIFEKYKVYLDLFAAQNGAGVATSLQNGAANIGLMGVPPITLVTINSHLNPLKTYELTATILDKDGNPMANSDVIVHAYGHEYRGKTDSNGMFKITVLKGTFAYDANNIIEVDGQMVELDEIQRVIGNVDLGKLHIMEET